MLLHRIISSRVHCFSCSCFIRNKHYFNTPSLSLSQLEDCIINSVRYEDGLIIFNKPVGVCFESGLVNEDSFNKTFPVCIKSALPALIKHLNLKQTFNIKIPERNVSGVTILADNEDLSNEVHKWQRVMRERREPCDVYHTIVIGEPISRKAFFDGTISLQSKNNVKRIVFSKEIGRNAVKRNEAKRVTIEHSTLSTVGDASLMEVKTSRIKWNCVRAYLATQTLTPVLGDTLYSGYVKYLMGSPVPEDIFNKTKLPSRKLPESLLKKLGIESRRDIQVPLHLHLSTVKLIRKRNQIIEFSMPYPEIFTRTIEQLGLIPEKSHSKVAASVQN